MRQLPLELDLLKFDHNLLIYDFANFESLLKRTVPRLGN
jgi:hypothetical protein